MSSFKISPVTYIKILHHTYKHLSTNVFGLIIGRVENISTQNKDQIRRIYHISNVVPVSHHNKGELMIPQYEILFEWIESHYASQGQEIIGIYYGNEIMNSKPIVIGDKNEQLDQVEENEEDEEDEVNDKNEENENNKEDNGENLKKISPNESNSKSTPENLQKKSRTEKIVESESTSSSLSMSDLPSSLKLLTAQLSRKDIIVWMIDNRKLASERRRNEIVLQQFESNDTGKNWFTEWNPDLTYSAKTYNWSFEKSSKQYSEEEICQMATLFHNEGRSYETLIDLQDHIDNVELDWRNTHYDASILE